MKIGKFAEINNVSIDTIRHYMDMGLIVPDKQGGQYFFDEKCEREFQEISDLKSMGFTLLEIKNIFFIKNFGRLTPYQEDEYYKSFFINKYSSIEKSIKDLENAKKRLEDKIQELSIQKKPKVSKMGIDINSLKLFACPKCGESLVLSEGIINNNQITSGVLKCCCSDSYYKIVDGILMNSNIEETYISKKQYNNRYIEDYINYTDSLYLDNLYKGLKWLDKNINFKDFGDKVFLELGTGIGFFLRNIYNNLPEDCTYIAVDRDIERHKFLKYILELTEYKRNIIFVCSDFTEIPIKKKSVDVLVDVSGTSNYSFEHEEFLLKLIDNYVKENSFLLGSYILFKNFVPNSLIKEKYRKNFYIKTVKDNIKDLNYSVATDRVSGYVEKGGRFENFFGDGEKVYSYYILGKR